MSVIRREGRRRWLLVGVAVLFVSSLPAALSLRPPPPVPVDPLRLRDLILASADQPYHGYVDSQGRLDVPDLPVLGEVLELARDATRIRVWYLGPSAWRVAVLEQTGERDIYQTATGTYLWDFERNLVTQVDGALPIRLPWAADLVPPELARRLLSAAAPADRVTAIPARRIAGVAAAGLRLTPSDPESTVGRLDVWADPATGLPLQVEIGDRAGAAPVLQTRFLEITRQAPDAGVVTPALPESAGFAVTDGAEVISAIGGVAPIRLPPSLAGRAGRRIFGIAGGVGIGAYGEGLSTFAVVALPGRVGVDSLRAASAARASPVQIGDGQGYEIEAGVVTAVLIRSAGGDRGRRRTFLLAGTVTPEVLRRAAAELLNASEPVR